MYQHPAHQVNIPREEVLCAPDSSNVLRHPVFWFLELVNWYKRKLVISALYQSYRR